MSAELAINVIKRFLASGDPEVLSISGLWGVGKTFAWHCAIEEHRKSNKLPINRYAYVSAFGLRSLDELKTAIFQSTVRLDRDEIEPTITSFTEHLNSIDGLSSLAERSGRRSMKLVEKLFSTIPYLGKSSDLLLPSASLLIKKQIVCLDDIERASSGLSINDLLGFVSMLKEERKCKVILLLNDESLDDKRDIYKTYLEKVIDQAVTFCPTAEESVRIALDINDPIDNELYNRIVRLGIVNIRVIKRLKKFVNILHPLIQDYNEKLLEKTITIIAIAGWSIFEPNIAPDLDRLLKYNKYSAIFTEAEISKEDAELNSMLLSYNFDYFDDFDLTIIDGLKNGYFNENKIRTLGAALHEQFEQKDARAEIQKVWKIYSGSFKNNVNELIESIKEAVENFGEHMSPSEINEFVSVIEELEESELSEELIKIYIDKQDHKDRSFFELSMRRSIGRPLDDRIIQAFQSKLEEMPLIGDPTGILLAIGTSNGWDTKDVEYLASLTEDQFYEVFANARGDDLSNMIRAAIRFSNFSNPDSVESVVGSKTQTALRKISEESRLNKMRVRPYLISLQSKDGETE